MTIADWLTAIAAWVGCVVSLATFGWAVAAAIVSARARPRLRCVATDDVLFRWGAAGELLFINIVLVARDRSAMIRDVSVQVKRVTAKSDVTRESPATLMKMGVPRDRGVPLHDYFFISSSPIDLIPTGEPARRVYMCRIDLTSDSIGGAVERYELETQKSVQANAGDPTAFGVDVKSRAEAMAQRVAEVAFAKDGRVRIRLDITYEDAAKPGSEGAKNPASSWTCCAIWEVEIRNYDEGNLKSAIEDYAIKYAWKAADPNADTPVHPTVYPTVRERKEVSG